MANGRILLSRAGGDRLWKHLQYFFLDARSFPASGEFTTTACLPDNRVGTLWCYTRPVSAAMEKPADHQIELSTGGWLSRPGSGVGRPRQMARSPLP